MAHTFTVVKTETCPFCIQAMAFLKALHEARGDFTVKVIDANANPKKARAVFERVGRNTVPQIFINDQYVGGWSELSRAAGSGKLDAFLDGAEWKEPERPPKTSAWKRIFGKRARAESTSG